MWHFSLVMLLRIQLLHITMKLHCSLVEQWLAGNTA